MAFSDDESDRIMHDVSEYHFVDGKDEPVSFAELPIVWGNDETSVGEVTEIFLRGYTDNHHLSVYRKVKAWKFDISLPNPEISVLSSEGEWIKLLKARNSYLEFIRTVVITVHFLHLLKNKVDIPSTALWDKLSKRFSFKEKPWQNDLRDHISLIREAGERDDDLKDSNVLSKFLKNPMKKIVLDKGDETSKNSSFIVDDSVVDYENREECDEEDDDFDLACALCDNGGDLLSCEGRCLRSFHATTEAGSDSQCKSLGLSDEKVKRLPMFYCNNCQYNKHQCYACGKLGSSDKVAGPEVFRCIVATCGYFYHPHCIAKLLSPGNDSKAEELRGKISTGEQFTCPIHACYLCKKRENKIENDLQFAVCRRCPRAYHRKCLPREIAFDGNEDDELVPRAWEGLLPYGRILIYCLDHEVDEDLLTPPRNHVIFPGPDAKKKRVSTLSSGGRISLSSEGANKKSRLVKQSKAVEKLSSSEKQGDSPKKTEKRMSFQRSSGQRKAVGTAMKTPKNSSSAKYRELLSPEGGPSLRDTSYSLTRQNSDPDEQIHTGELEDGFGLAELDSSMELESYTIGRILTMIKGTASKPKKVKLNENHNEMTKPNPPTECRGKSSMRVDDQHLLTKHEPSLEHRASVIEKEKSSGPENSQKGSPQSSHRHSREGEQGKKMDENLVTKSSAGKRLDSHNPYNSSLKRFKGFSNRKFSRGKPSNQKRGPVSSSDTQRRARYDSGGNIDRRSNSKHAEDSVRRFNGNNNNKRKGYIINEGRSKRERTSSPALDDSFRNPREQFLAHNHAPDMQRCAPRMDESNHTRVNEHHSVDRNDINDEPRTVDRNVMNDPRRGHPTTQSNCLGFASSPCSSYLNGSCGWIDE